MAAASASSGGFTTIDWAILVAYAASTLGLGWYYSRQQKSTEEYFVGSGKMNPFLIGISLFATLLSTISYRQMPGEALGMGPVNMTTMLALPFVYLVVGYVLLPLYMQQRVTSAYELLESKLGLSVRLLGAVLFVILRLVWMSLLVYLTSDAMTIMLGLGKEYIPLVALVTGLVSVVYTSIGGLRAVVITDLMQTLLLYGGALLVIGTVTYHFGGIGWFPREWNPTWDTQPIFPSDPSTRVTVVGSILSFFIWHVCTAGGDQTCVQRFMATEDARAARKAFAVQMAASVLIIVTLGLVGFALLGFFETHPELIPGGGDLKSKADDIFPYFIVHHLPPGITGLVVAGMFAAAMSSIDSGVNSITAVVMTDGFDRFGRPAKTEREHVTKARWLAFAIGAAAIIGSSQIGSVPGNITAVTHKTSNLLTTPIFGLFFYALFVPFATPLGVWIGTFCGITAAILVGFSGPIFGMVPGTNLDPISFQWIAPIAITANLVTGCLASLLLPFGRRLPSTP
ncbi:MAG: sodium-coupled permease [Planctomycetaceae bacterium]|nr:sodium-coupled permease [Planctomycetaceae bacterium]